MTHPTEIVIRTCPSTMLRLNIAAAAFGLMATASAAAQAQPTAAAATADRILTCPVTAVDARRRTITVKASCAALAAPGGAADPTTLCVPVVDNEPAIVDVRKLAREKALKRQAFAVIEKSVRAKSTFVVIRTDVLQCPK